MPSKPDSWSRIPVGLALMAVVGLSHACAYPSEDGWRDTMTGNLTCRAAPAAIQSWSGRYARRPGDHVELEPWLMTHPKAVNARYGVFCETALHTAAQLGREDIATLLLTHGADPHANDEHGNTPVTKAAAYGQVDVLKVLVAKRADVNRRGRNGTLPLVAAIGGLGTETGLERRLEIARILIAAGADVNAHEPGNGYTPLYFAAGPSTSHSDQMIQLLLAHGADVRASDAHGTPLLVAVAGAGSRSAVQLLLDRGADVTVAGKTSTALSAAAYGGHLDVVSLLLEHGADVNHRIPGSPLEWDWLPLATALVVARSPDKTTMAARREVAAMLIAHGADVNASTQTGETLLHRAAFEGDLAAVDLLLSHGATVTSRDASGTTPLHRAAQAGRFDVATRLLAKGADGRAAASDGTTPLSLAAGDPELEALIQRHAKN
jgi:ankyrin repeat protein